MTSIPFNFPGMGSGFHTMGQPGTAPTANRGLSGAEINMLRTILQANINVNINVRLDGFHPPRQIGGVCGPKPRMCCPKPPVRQDCCHPPGSLKTSPEGAVTTPGGYKIEVLGPCEWKITGPDGKNTRVWGDPHVAEGDGGTWDFKRDSTFVLGDGTRINVATKPAGPNATVTGGLEIISGNDRVKITAVDTAKSKTGPVTRDGYAHANSFGNNDVFVMGRETDDWSFQGREVIGSYNLGESFQLGDKLPAGRTHHKPWHAYRGGFQKSDGGSPLGGPSGIAPGGPNGILPGEPHPNAPTNPFAQQLNALLQSLFQQIQGMMSFCDLMPQRNFGCDPFCAPGTQGNWMDRRQQHLGNSFGDIGTMLNAFSQLDSLSRSVQSFRLPFMV
ncbi:DUF1521 domain-containing protein [Hyalangium gracile]|uniref:DUF1521 domain-containing protein n=1 Tax=Hyalangium gracile TaxID=394092 RepID=UPI001CCAF179|nr:DUF1521 domain-containing protein [Hyalangium gracile]